MITQLRKLLALPLAVLALALSGCETAKGPTEAMPPQEVRFQESGSVKLVKGEIPAFSVSQEIGPGGGVIVGATGYSLAVPPGAVSQPTVFTFESLSSSGYLGVKLTATAVGSSDLNDVGRAGFLVPLTLILSTETATSTLEGKDVTVVWVRPDGVLERMPSSFDLTKKIVTGKLTHFSQYAVGGN
jgi:hypothetical protein